MFCTFWFGNVLRATLARNFSSLIWLAGSAPAALASLLFDSPEPQGIGKTQCFATFLPFRAPGSSFFRLFLLSDLLSSTLLFSLTLPVSAFHLSTLSEVWLVNLLRPSPHLLYFWIVLLSRTHFQPIEDHCASCNCRFFEHCPLFCVSTTFSIYRVSEPRLSPLSSRSCSLTKFCARSALFTRASRVFLTIVSASWDTWQLSSQHLWIGEANNLPDTTESSPTSRSSPTIHKF